MTNTQSRLMGGMLALSLVLPMATASGQSQPSAKVTAKTANVVLLPETDGTGDWQTLLANNIKTPNQKDLFIGASFEVGLYTRTLVKSRNLVPDSSTALASVQVRVLLDGNVVEPGVVVFGRRSQTLTATLEGAIGDCLTLVTNLDGSVSIIVDPDCVTPEEIELILSTMDAATFNFVAADVPQGIHTISVQARITTSGSAQQGSFAATGTVGKGTMTVESVRLIKDEDVILEIE